MSFQKRVVSGIRATGPLHLGHYFGALKNWVRLQNEGEYKCYFFSADWHALTTGYADGSDIREFRRTMVAEWIACGIDPSRSTVFSQAAVPEHGELATLLGMLTPVSWLQRVPSYKEQQQELAHKDLSTIGFLGYPLLQTADICIYKGTHVPVGEDQLAHIELSREVLRRFNNTFEKGVPLFPEPQGLVTEVPRLPGLDSRKMSKSYNNAVYLSEDPKQIEKKILTAPTDPQRIKRTDPGDPELCNIFSYQKLFQNADELNEIATGCRTAGIGCVDCKRRLLGKLEPFLEPIREKSLQVLGSGEVDDILSVGDTAARVEAQSTMACVREAMRL